MTFGSLHFTPSLLYLHSVYILSLPPVSSLRFTLAVSCVYFIHDKTWQLHKLLT